MKTIEERIEELFVGHLYCALSRDEAKNTLTELAADLQAEKEKEVAELRETRDDLEARLGSIERSHNCDGDGCEVCYQLMEADKEGKK